MKYFKVEVLVKVDDGDHDSKCDEIFSVKDSLSKRDSHIVEYKEIEKKQFDNEKHRIFLPEGGI